MPPRLLPRPNAIVVLGARVLSDGRLSQALSRRVERAAQAFREAPDALLVCSGGRAWAGHIEADCMREHLVRLGVEPSSIVLETLSMSTAQNARLTTALLRQRGIGRALVVTCPWHLPRALADFRLCGLEVDGLAADSVPLPFRKRVWIRARERSCVWIDHTRLRSGLA